ncbi:hypothetical protein D3C84_747740 [compost metagenome]
MALSWAVKSTITLPEMLLQTLMSEGFTILIGGVTSKSKEIKLSQKKLLLFTGTAFI